MPWCTRGTGGSLHMLFCSTVTLENEALRWAGPDVRALTPRWPTIRRSERPLDKCLMGLMSWAFPTAGKMSRRPSSLAGPEYFSGYSRMTLGTEGTRQIFWARLLR